LSRFNPEAAGDLNASYGLRMARDDFRVDVAGRRIEVRRGQPETPTRRSRPTCRRSRPLIFDGRDRADGERAGALRLAGDRTLAARLLALYAPAAA
jgi:hypothetical protein